MPKVHLPVLDSFLFTEYREELDRYVGLLDEDQALRTTDYDNPDGTRRRMRIACNECDTPWCCNQLVSMEFVEALVLYRWAAEHVPRQLTQALERGRSLASKKPLDDETFFRRKMPCAFLLKGRCSVYAVRPHACRTHYMAGPPRKCYGELAPSETYAMDPDPVINEEIRKLADDVRFFAQIESVGPHEMNELLALIDGLAGEERWKEPRVLGQERIAEERKF